MSIYTKEYERFRPFLGKGLILAVLASVLFGAIAQFLEGGVILYFVTALAIVGFLATVFLAITLVTMDIKDRRKKMEMDIWDPYRSRFRKKHGLSTSILDREFPATSSHQGELDWREELDERLERNMNMLEERVNAAFGKPKPKKRKRMLPTSKKKKNVRTKNVVFKGLNIQTDGDLYLDGDLLEDEKPSKVSKKDDLAANPLLDD